MLNKPNKLDHTNLKAYWVISLLNHLGKICERGVTDMLTEWCEVNHVLYSS